MNEPIFPRGPGALVTVLLPTRGRGKTTLPGSIAALLDKAHDPSAVEILFKIDEDDPDTLEAYRALAAKYPKTPMRAFVGPRGRGYHDIILWDNEMVRHASGDWVFFYNDDAYMETGHWDYKLASMGVVIPWPGIFDMCLVVMSTVGRPYAQEFIAFRRKGIQLTGHLALSSHADNWLFSVYNFLGFVLFSDINVKHVSDSIEDQTRKDSVEAHKESIASLRCSGSLRTKLEDVRVLLEHSIAREKAMVWAADPQGPGWYFWKGRPDGAYRTAYLDGAGNRILLEYGQKAVLLGEGGLWSKM